MTYIAKKDSKVEQSYYWQHPTDKHFVHFGLERQHAGWTAVEFWETRDGKSFLVDAYEPSMPMPEEPKEEDVVNKDVLICKHASRGCFFYEKLK